MCRILGCVFMKMIQYESLNSALAELAGSEEYAVRSVFGGDINRAFKLTFQGREIFMKIGRAHV